MKLSFVTFMEGLNIDFNNHILYIVCCFLFFDYKWAMYDALEYVLLVFDFIIVVFCVNIV